jgi:carbon monoxide dehydrogenase subunit G
MKLEQSFDVEAPVDRVWEALIDVERVAPCLPGAEITEAGEDGTYRGNFTVKLGPTTASYRGELAMESVDADARRVVMRANGQDKRGQGSAKATIESVLRGEGGKTTVDVVTDFTITGRLARFGRGGMIKDVSARLMRDFSACLARAIEAAPAGDTGSGESVTPADPGPSGAPLAAGSAPAEVPRDRTGTPADPGPSGAPVGAGAKRAAAPAAPAPAARPAPQPAKPVQGFSLLLSVLVERVKRLFGR